MQKIVLCIFFIFTLFSYGQEIDPLAVSTDNLPSQKKWVDSIYNTFSLDEKIGQLFMPMVFSERDSLHYKSTLDLIKNHKIGGLVFSRGGPVKQSQWLNTFQENSTIP